MFYASYRPPPEHVRNIPTDLLLLGDLSRLLGAGLLLALALLQESLGNQDVVLGGDGPVVTCRLVRSPRSIFFFKYGRAVERRLENCRLKRDILSGG